MRSYRHPLLRLCLVVCLSSLTAFCYAQIDQVGPIDGDLNGDSFVGLDDLAILLNNWNQSVTPPGDISQGDASGDGQIGLDDLQPVLDNWNTGYPLPAQRNLNLGINLAQLNYYSRDWVFVDAIKQAKPWVATTPTGNPFDLGTPVTTDTDGWPILQEGEAAQTIMFDGTDGAYPAGQYVCTYDGTGEIVFQWDASVASSSPGRMLVDVSPTNTGILMRIASSDPNDPIRNIKLWMPGFEDATSPFHPLFLERLSKFKVIRFMDWNHTNEADETLTWNSRTTPSYYTQGGPRGVAIEYMVDLCNELHADPWFCMPHTANVGYIQNFATKVLNRLEPGRKVYIEWSNEVWNAQFDAYSYVTSRSKASSFSPEWFDFWAYKAGATFDIWRSAFGDQKDRLVRVAAGQEANVWVTKNLAERLGDNVDAIACAAYFGEDGADFNASTTPDQIITDAMNRVIPEKSTDYYQRHGDLAQSLSQTLGRHIALLAYEGGQHYADANRNVPYAQALLDVQTSPRMFNAYLMNLSAFEQAGGELMVPFNFIDRPGDHGAWGHLTTQDATLDTSPKFKALLYYIKDQ